MLKLIFVIFLFRALKASASLAAEAQQNEVDECEDSDSPLRRKKLLMVRQFQSLDSSKVEAADV